MITLLAYLADVETAAAPKVWHDVFAFPGTVGVPPSLFQTDVAADLDIQTVLECTYARVRRVVKTAFKVALYNQIDNLRVRKGTIGRQSDEMLWSMWLGGLDETVQHVFQ